jgi:hypothetical protein
VPASNCNFKEKKATSRSKHVAEDALVISGSVDQRPVDATPSLCGRTSDGGCPSQPIQYQFVYDSLNQIFTAFHRTPSKQVGTQKKIAEQYDADEVTTLYQSFCSHLQKYKTGRCTSLWLFVFFPRRQFFFTCWSFRLFSFQPHNHHLSKWFAYLVIILRCITLSNKVRIKLSQKPPPVCLGHVMFVFVSSQVFHATEYAGLRKIRKIRVKHGTSCGRGLPKFR